MTKPTLTDKELFELIAEDDTEAFQILFRRHHGALSRVLMRYSRDKEQIKDWTQEIYVLLWEIRGKLPIETIANFKGYLIVLTRNYAIRCTGKKKQFQMVLTEDFSDFQIADNSLAEDIEHRDLYQAYQTALQKMPEPMQEAYCLSREKGYTYPKVAEEMGISIKTVEARISRALSILRHELVSFL
jgi:RNA polymerase sigma-70 factor (ECF subfamily)